MQKISLLLFSFLFILTSFLFSQGSKGEIFYDGWAVTKKGDTLRGKICYENTKTGEFYQHSKKVIFVDTSGSKRKYGPEKLTSFYCNDKLFEYISLDESLPPFLMQKIADGDIKMYKAWFLTETSTSQNMKYEEAIFIKKKEHEKFTEILDKGFKKTMKEFFDGNNQILELIKTNNWGPNDLEKIIAAYNEME